MKSEAAAINRTIRRIWPSKSFPNQSPPLVQENQDRPSLRQFFTLCPCLKTAGLGLPKPFRQPTDMDSDQGKLFIGGISWETDEDKLKDYFQHYGDVIQTVVMRDKLTGKPRGFGFVVFADPNVLDAVLQDRHTIDGRTVEAKRALSREEQQGSKAGNVNSSSISGGGNNNKTKKIFVGGLPPTLTEDEFRQYFETYGTVTDVVVMYDQQTNRPRGFGFILFDSEDAVDRVLHKTFHDLNDKQVEVKRAFPKDANANASGRPMSGGNYQGYGGNKTDSNRYVTSQNTGGGYPSYGSSGYGYPGYGGYGSYGGANMNPGYGNANTGYGGLSGSAYGNPNAPNSGYGSGPRSSWSSQGPAGYGNAGYGSAASGQSLTGMAGYGNQGYGYSGFGGNDGAYGNPSAYGSVGRVGGAPRTNSPIGGGGNSGYGSASWRPDIPQASGNYGSNGSHGSQVGYGSNYD